MSNQQFRLKISLELVWWFASALLAAAVLFPIYNVFKFYPFLWLNVAFILIFVTFTRYIFLLKTTFLARLTWIKIILIVISIPLLFNLISQVAGFQAFLDEEGPTALLKPDFLRGAPSSEAKIWVLRYMRTEMIFFGVGSIIATLLLPFRMILSIWRTVNTDDKV